MDVYALFIEVRGDLASAACPTQLAMTKHLFVAFLLASAAPSFAQSVPPQVAELREQALKDDYAYDIVEGLTTEVGPRLAGHRSGSEGTRLGGPQTEGDGLRQRARGAVRHAGVGARRRKGVDHRSLPSAACGDGAGQQRRDPGPGHRRRAGRLLDPRRAEGGSGLGGSRKDRVRRPQDAEDAGRLELRLFRQSAPRRSDDRQPEGRARHRRSLHRNGSSPQSPHGRHAL